MSFTQLSPLDLFDNLTEGLIGILSDEEKSD